jgi:hypothetical protein
MLTLAAVGGFFIPVVFGHLVPHTGFGIGWSFLAIVSFAFALVGLAGGNPEKAPRRRGAAAPGPDAQCAKTGSASLLTGRGPLRNMRPASTAEPRNTAAATQNTRR